MENQPAVQFMTREEYDQMQQTLRSVAADYNPLNGKLARKEFDRKRVSEAFQMAYDLIGGDMRFAHWAHENQTEFYKLYGRMLPTGSQIDLNHNGEITFKHVLPPSKLDKLENTDAGHSVESKVTD